MNAPGYAIGDCLEVLRTLPDQWANCCVTSPPYWGLRDYGHDEQLGLEPTPEEYVAKLVEIFAEVRRVLKDDGTLWLNLGDSYAGSWGARSKWNQDCLHGKNKHSIDERYPVGRTGTPPPGLKSKDLAGIPWMTAFALRSDGWYLRSDIIWSKPNPMPESVTDRPTKAHEYLFLLSKQSKYHYDADAVREPSVTGDNRRPYGVGQVDERGNGHSRGGGAARRGRTDHRNKRSVWTVPNKPYTGAHFACYPPDLIKPCILAGCPEGGIVLDPFFGSGTTGRVAEDLNRRWFGIELNPDYEKLIRDRTAQRGLL